MEKKLVLVTGNMISVESESAFQLGVQVQHERSRIRYNNYRTFTRQYRVVRLLPIFSSIFFFFLNHTGNEGSYYKFKDVTDYGKDVQADRRKRRARVRPGVYVQKIQVLKKRGNRARAVPALRTWIMASYLSKCICIYRVKCLI